MLELSEKLKKFSTEVLSEANESSQKKWQEFTEKLAAEYDKKETAFLEEGYHTIQNGLKQIDREKSGRMSKALMDNRQQVLQKRAEIVNRVFEQLKVKLVEYTKTEEYLAVLDKRIEKTLLILGSGQCRIVLTASDFARAQMIMAKYPQTTFETEAKQVKIPMIGGCQGYHEEKNIFYDNSFARQLVDKRENFLQEMAAELKIED